MQLQLMEKSESLEADSRSDGQKDPRLLWNPTFHYSVHKNLPLHPSPTSHLVSLT
jgi:hypothetical protein